MAEVTHILNRLEARMPISSSVLRQRSEGRTIAVFGDVYRFMARSEDTNVKYAIWKTIVPPGGGGPLVPLVWCVDLGAIGRQEGYQSRSGRLNRVSKGLPSGQFLKLLAGRFSTRSSHSNAILRDRVQAECPSLWQVSAPPPIRRFCDHMCKWRASARSDRLEFTDLGVEAFGLNGFIFCYDSFLGRHPQRGLESHKDCNALQRADSGTPEFIAILKNSNRLTRVIYRRLFFSFCNFPLPTKSCLHSISHAVWLHTDSSSEGISCTPDF